MTPSSLAARDFGKGTPGPARKKRCDTTCSREEEEEDAESHRPFLVVNKRVELTYILGECEMYKEERDELEEIRKMDE